MGFKVSNRFIVICLLSVGLSACTYSRDMYLPDGSVGHSISCGGTLNSFSGCYQKAGELCGAGGYDIVDRNGEAIPFSNSSGSIVGNQHMISGGYQSNFGMIVNRDLFVRCKNKVSKK